VGLAPDLAGLIPLFFRYVPAEDLAGVEPSDVVGVVRSHCELAGERVPGRPLVRVLDPDREMEGRTRRATVVQVVTDDMPYLVDSMVAQLAHCGVTVYRMAYPIVVVRRSVTGHLQDVLADADPTAPSNGELVESWTYLEISRVASAATARQIEQRLVDVLNDVREVVEDSERMCAAARQVADELEADPPVGLAAGEAAEGAAAEGADFLRWLASWHRVWACCGGTAWPPGPSPRGRVGRSTRCCRKSCWC
jgi:glutamate dehydrogenase